MGLNYFASFKLLLKRSRALTEKFKQKCYRKDEDNNSPTPCKKVKQIMDLGPKEEKRKLVFGEILAAQLKKVSF